VVGVVVGPIDMTDICTPKEVVPGEVVAIAMETGHQLSARIQQPLLGIRVEPPGRFVPMEAQGLVVAAQVETDTTPKTPAED